jgi:hypothetical protein
VSWKKIKAEVGTVNNNEESSIKNSAGPVKLKGPYLKIKGHKN